MRKLYAVLAGLVLGLAFNLHAQLTLIGGGVDTPISSAPDSIVAVTADAYELERVGLESLPTFTGTFFVADAYGTTPPYPGLPSQFWNCPVWVLDADKGIFLVDASGGEVAVNTRRLGNVSVAVTSERMAAAVEAQGNKIADLIQRVQESQMLREMSLMFGLEMLDSENESSPNSPSFAVILNLDGLWLEITGVTNGVSYYNLHNSTNAVYAIWTTTDLLQPFTVETELWPSDMNCQPFTLQNNGRSPLFVRAEDWTGVDSNSDGVPDWWIWNYFHTLDLNATNLDSQGNTLGYDYTNNIDPNVISFTVLATNQYFNQSSVPLQISVSAGWPVYYSILVNDSNPSNAVWQSYTSTNVTATLGSTDGVYTVSVGLRGYPDNAQQTWQMIQVTRDTVTALIVITNPTVNTTVQPMVQLQGYALKPLTDISYDISNALTVASNQPGQLTLRHLDPDTGKFTTNDFECLDISLTNGVNTITVHATDMAGNISTTNFNITLDFSTATNPVLQVIWPPDGGQIASGSFTCYGKVDDPTATVSAQITDANGNSNLIAGQVERDGNFWVEYLPLAAGTNFLSLSITNAAGYSTTTNLTLIQNTNVLAMNAITADQLCQSSVNVTGVVSDASCAVYVNGVQGVNNGDGTWYALNVPNPGDGVATFTMQANFASGTALNNTNVDQPSYLYVSGYYLDWTKTYTLNYGSGPHPNFATTPPNEHHHLFWQPKVNVTAYDVVASYIGNCTNLYSWPADNYILNYVSPSSNGILTHTCATNVEVVGPPSINFEHCNITTNGQVGLNLNLTYQRTAQTALALHTGGKSLSHRQNLFQISGSATAITNLASLTGRGVTSTSIAMGVLRTLYADGNKWVVKEDNREFDSTPIVLTTLNPDYYTFNAAQQKYKPYITANDVTLDPVAINVTNCVGQKIIFKLQFAPSLPNGVLITNQNTWVLPPKYVNAKRWFKTNEGYYITTCHPEATWFVGGMGVSDTPYCTFYTNDSWSLQAPETGAWWVSSGPKAVTCFPIITLANGQQFSLGQVQGNFSVIKPIVTSVISAHTAGTGILTNEFPRKLSLCNGTMTFDVSISKTFPGHFGVTQLVKYYTESGYIPPLYLWWDSTDGEFWLDSSYEYYEDNGQSVSLSDGEWPSNDPYPSSINIADAPQGNLYLYYGEYYGQWKDYVRFTPSGTGSIPVTIGRIDWSWNGEASLGYFTGWIVTSNSVTGPTLDTTDDSFPEWTKDKPSPPSN